MSANICAISLDEIQIPVPCPHLVDEGGTQFVPCGADVEVVLSGTATYTVPKGCTSCDREFSDVTRAELMQAAETAWESYSPSDAEIERQARDIDDSSFRESLRAAGRGHLLA